MRRLFSVHPRVLIALLTTLVIIAGSLLWARRILLENSDVSPSSHQPSTPQPTPPLLPKPLAPQSSDQEATPLSTPTDSSASSKEMPNGIEFDSAPPRESLPPQGKARVLPPIQAEPDEEEVVEFAPALEPEQPEDETPDEGHPPLLPPDSSPDFAR